MTRMEAERRVTALTDMEKNGLTTRAAMLRVLYAAQELSAELGEQGLTSENFAQAVDMGRLRPRYDTLVSAMTALDSASKDSQQMLKEGLSSDIVKRYAESAGKLKATASAMIENIKNKVKSDTLGRLRDRDGGYPENFKSSTNSLVDHYNRISNL